MSGLGQRKTLIGALGLALVALLVDQVLLQRTPPTAVAADGPTGPGPVDAEPGRVTITDITAVIEALSRTAPRAEPWFDEPIQRDPFAASIAIPAPTAPPLESTPDPNAASPTPNQAAAFVAAHTLDSVLLGSQPRAVINGRLYTLGDTIAGFELIRIDEARVQLAREDALVVLTVAGPATP